MRIPPKQMRAILDDLVSMGAPVPQGFYGLPLEELCSQCNGIGSDDESVKWATGPLNTFVSWMLPASVPHDIWWGPLYNDGSRERFELSNKFFKQTLHLIAGRSFGWVPIRFIRERLREARREEARIAYEILSSDKCFAIWTENAVIEPGPERMSPG